MSPTAVARRTTAPVPAVSPVSQRPSAPRTTSLDDAGGRGLTVLVWFVLVLTVGGAVLAVRQLSSTPSIAAAWPERVLRTAYGLVVVGDITVSAAAEAGKDEVAHDDTAPAGAATTAADVRFNVPITLQNSSDAAVRYAPGQFGLVTGDGRPARPEDSPLLTGELQPGAAVALRLTFAVPAGVTSSQLTVDGGEPAAGLDLRLPAVSAPDRPVTPQDQPAQPASPADGAGPEKDAPSAPSHH